MIATLRRLPRLETAIALVAVVILIVVGALRDQSDKQVVQVDSYSTFDTATGGYRAWYELLEREGANVQRFEERPGFLDRSVDTYIWADPLPFDERQDPATENDLHAMDAWVKAGGRLVYVGHDDRAADLHVWNLPHSTTKNVRGRPVIAPEFARAGVRAVKPIVELRWAAGSYRVLLADARGPLIVEYPRGKGQIVAAIDEPSFTNAQIAQPDRPRLAYALALPKPGTRVAFNESVHGFVVPEHWWAVVPRAFAIAIWSALAIVLIAFAGAALRLGPPVLPRPVEPTSAAFLDALAALFQRGAAVRKAMLDAARSAKRSIATGLGVPEDTPPENIAALIERPEQRDLFLELVQVSSNAFPNEKNLVRGVALAQRLRKDFTTHGRSRN